MRRRLVAWYVRRRWPVVVHVIPVPAGYTPKESWAAICAAGGPGLPGSKPAWNGDQAIAGWSNVIVDPLRRCEYVIGAG